MARALKPREIFFRSYNSHLNCSAKEVIQRRFLVGDGLSSTSLRASLFSSFSSLAYRSPAIPFTKYGFQKETVTTSNSSSLVSMVLHGARALSPFFSRSFSTTGHPFTSSSLDSSASNSDVAPRIKFKRLDKTARHIMQILDKEAVEEVKLQREIPDIRPGYIVQLKVEVPENKRRVSTLKGIVIARRNAGLNTTFRIRRLVAGVGVESLFPLYSPNIKEIKVVDKKRVRRAKLYYLRDKMNALKKQ